MVEKYDNDATNEKLTRIDLAKALHRWSSEGTSELQEILRRGYEITTTRVMTYADGEGYEEYNDLTAHNDIRAIDRSAIENIICRRKDPGVNKGAERVAKEADEELEKDRNAEEEITKYPSSQMDYQELPSYSPPIHYKKERNGIFGGILATLAVGAVGLGVISALVGRNYTAPSQHSDPHVIAPIQQSPAIQYNPEVSAPSKPTYTPEQVSENRQAEIRKEISRPDLMNKSTEEIAKQLRNRGYYIDEDAAHTIRNAAAEQQKKRMDAAQRRY